MKSPHATRFLQSPEVNPTGCSSKSYGVNFQNFPRAPDRDSVSLGLSDLAPWVDDIVADVVPEVESFVKSTEARWGVKRAESAKLNGRILQITLEISIELSFGRLLPFRRPFGLIGDRRLTG